MVRHLLSFGLALVLTACAAAPATLPDPPTAAATPRAPDRPIPYPIDVPDGYLEAVRRGTRTASGEPGPAYWQQWADYTLSARIDTEARRLDGTARIVYRNNSPDALNELHVDLHQNLHAPGVVRVEPVEVTGGVELNRVAVGGVDLATGVRAGPRYGVVGTRLLIVPPEPVRPNTSVTLDIDWSSTHVS
jgi:hypothetical protein